MQLIVDTSGESTEETDVLELIRDNWRLLGIAMFPRPSQREVFRKRVFSGKSMMSVWSGLNNGIATPGMSPSGLAPTPQAPPEAPMSGEDSGWNHTGGETARQAAGRDARRWAWAAGPAGRYIALGAAGGRIAAPVCVR